MRNVKVAWINEDEDFSIRLRNYAKRHYTDALEMVLYTELPPDKELREAKVVVVTTGMFHELLAENNRILIILHEGSVPERLIQKKKIYKYMPADEILDQVLWALADEESDGEVRIGKEKTRLIGVGGDVSISDGVIAAMTMADILSESKKVLFLNMSQCGAGVFEMNRSQDVDEMSGQYDISRMLYAVLSRKKYAQIESIFDSCVRHDRDYDYILPARNPEHFMEEVGGLVAEAIEFIAKTGRYAFVVYVMNYIPGKMPELIKNTDRYFAIKERAAPAGGGDDFIHYMSENDATGEKIRILEYDRAHLREKIRDMLIDYIRED